MMKPNSQETWVGSSRKSASNLEAKQRETEHKKEAVNNQKDTGLTSIKRKIPTWDAWNYLQMSA